MELRIIYQIDGGDDIHGAMPVRRNARGPFPKAARGGDIDRPLMQQAPPQFHEPQPSRRLIGAVFQPPSLEFRLKI